MADASILIYLIEVASGLTVLGLSAGVGYLVRGKRERNRVSEAPFVYVNRLDELITQGVEEGPQQAVINARAIVAARNSLASSLVSISSSLNSQIDTLAEQIGEPRLRPAGLSDRFPNNPFDQNVLRYQTYETIQVLAKIWPAKRSEIIIAVRKILAELGLPFDPRKEQAFQAPTPRNNPEPPRQLLST